MTKIWHKPSHKRKMWKRMSLYGKTVYYLQPFLIHLLDTWQQPVPFPTLFKILYSCFLILLIMLPIIYPIIIVISYYAIIQYLLESALQIYYPRHLDVVHYFIELYNFEIYNEKYLELLILCIERWRYLIMASASCIDYIRLTLALATS